MRNRGRHRRNGNRMELRLALHRADEPRALVCVSTAGPVVAEHLTADQCQAFCALSYTGASVTNSIVAGVASQTGVAAVSSVTSGSGLFQTVAGGNYYLAANSVNQGAGTVNISPQLLSDLQNRTTQPPVFLTANFTGNTNLAPQARRDLCAPPDIGYHYDPLDCVWSNLTVNLGVTLTLTNGVAVGMYGATGLTLNTSSTLTSQGTPINLNLLAPSAVVQEQPMTALATLLVGSGRHLWSSLNLRFTDLPVLGGSVTYLSVNDHGLTLFMPGPVTLRDCQLLGGQLSILLGNIASTAMTVSWTNNLFERCAISFSRSSWSPPQYPSTFIVSLDNNLFHHGALGFTYWISSSDTTNTLFNWPMYNNLFENVEYDRIGHQLGITELDDLRSQRWQ